MADWFTKKSWANDASSFNAIQTYDNKKKIERTGNFLGDIFISIKTNPKISFSSQKLTKQKQSPKVSISFIYKSLESVVSRLKNPINVPTWKEYPQLSLEDKKNLTNFWKSLGENERERFCPDGIWQKRVDGSVSSSIMLAASKNRFEALRLLIDLHSSKQERFQDENKPSGPVYECLNLGHVEAAYHMVEKGFALPATESLSKMNISGRSMAWFAAKENNAALIKEIIERGGPVDIRDKDGWTPLLVAANRGNLDAVKALALGHVDVSVMDVAGWMPLHRSCLHGYPDVAKTLIVDMAAKADEPDHLGRTPLHRAVERNQEKVVELLCELCEVDPNIAGYVEGYLSPISSLELAKSRKQKVIVDILENYIGKKM